MVGNPAVISGENGKMNIFARGSDNRLYHNALTVSSSGGPTFPFITKYGIQSSGWNNLGGQLGGDPAVISDENGRINIVVKLTDDSLAYNTLDASIETDSPKAIDLGGISTSNPTLIFDSQERLNVFVLGNDSSTYYKVQNTTGDINDANEWSLWSGIGGKLRLEDPVVVLDSSGRTNVFVVGDDGDIHRKVNLPPSS